MPAQTQAQKDLNFTKEQGLNIQASQLLEWKSVLTDTAFAELEEIATKDNHKAIDGFDVVRGNDLNIIIHNQLMQRQ